MLVLKFGGTSLESGEAIERMESIVKSRLPRHPVVVVSALGKVTDNLLALGTEAAAGRTAAVGVRRPREAGDDEGNGRGDQRSGCTPAGLLT